MSHRPPTFGTSVIISNNSSAVGPVLAACGGSLYIVWAGTDGKRGINYVSSTDGVTFGNKTLFGSETSCLTRPAFAEEGPAISSCYDCNSPQTGN